MKKKNLAVKGMAMLMVCAMVVSNIGIVAHAEEYDDGCVRDDVASGGGGSASLDIGGGNSDSGSNYTGGGSLDNGSGDSGNVSSGSSDNGSSDSGNVSNGSSDNESSDSENSGGTSNTTSTTLTMGNTVSVPGFETWRKVSSATAGTFKVYHKGIEQYTLQLKKDDTSVGFKSAGLYQTEDGRYFINIVLPDNADGIDAYNVVTMKGDKKYLPQIGISGVCINANIVLDVDAEIAEAEAAK